MCADALSASALIVAWRPISVAIHAQSVSLEQHRIWADRLTQDMNLMGHKVPDSAIVHLYTYELLQAHCEKYCCKLCTAKRLMVIDL